MYGDEEISKSLEVESNSRIPQPTITEYEGIPIDYWYVQGFENRPWIFDGYFADRVIDDVILYPHLGDLTLTLDPGPGGVVDPLSVKVNLGKPFSLPVPITTAKRDGYSLAFDHWSCNGVEVPLSGSSWIYGKPENNKLVAEYHYGDDYTEATFNIVSSEFEATYEIEKVKDGSKTGSYYIPSTYHGFPIARIGGMAFDSTNMSSINIPDSITYIGFDAFSMCPNLTSLAIPKSVTQIEDEIASHCPSLTSITVDPENKFYDSRDNCNAIIHTQTNTLIQGCSSTFIPNTVETIGSHSFNGCSTLASINIPISVKNIEMFAFAGCRELSSIYIPKSVTTMDSSVFLGCDVISIYCEAESKPNGWDEEWVGNEDAPVYWGVSPNN